MLGGLLIANLIDLDHLYPRIIGEVGWFESACPEIGMQCSFNFYPLHNIYMLIVAVILSALLLSKNKKMRFVGWIGLGIVVHLALDYIHLLTGFAI